MTSLPTGTVTFLMTDIEGSTRLVSAAGEAFPRLLDEHFALLDSAVTGNGGTVVSSEGDALFAVFPSARQAFAAALDGQRQISGHGWPSGAAVKVRMGIHAGEAIFGGRDYTGIDVHRTARISAAAWGGEILVSDTARALAGEALPDGASVRDLGVHTLRDLPAPERLFQLCGPGLASDFPPPRSLATATRTNLPTPLTGFVGRSREMGEVRALLASQRLVSLTGPGGTGKTRLAIEAARSVLGAFPGGVWFVPLEAVRDPALVLPTVAHTCGVADQPGRSIVEVLAEGLGTAAVLLVLDNLEQVVDAGPEITALLEAAQGLTVLASSRLPLGVAGEQVYPVPILGLPGEPGRPTAADIAGADAVVLFVQRARAVRPDFALDDDNAPAIAAICRRLDGLPLAIELAASRINLLAPAQILDRLDHRLGLLSSGRRDLPERQRTLRGAIDWSYELLTEEECACFRRFAVFAGGADLDAALAVLDPDGSLKADPLDLLGALVDRSLVRSAADGDRTRFEMLETIREYAAERLRDAGEDVSVRTVHCRWFVDYAERSDGALTSGRRVAVLDDLDRELPNLRAAIAFALDQADQASALRILYALRDFWRERSHITEVRRQFDQVFAHWDPAAPRHERIRALLVAAQLASWQTDYATTGRLTEEARAASEIDGDPRIQAQVLNNVGWSSIYQDPRAGIEAFRASARLAAEVGDAGTLAEAQQGLAVGEFQQGNYEASRAASLAAIEAGRSAGDDATLAINYLTLGMVDLRLGDPDAALDHLRTGLARVHGAGFSIGVSIALDVFGVAAGDLGDPAAAVRLGTVADRIRKESGGAPTMAIVGLESPVERGRRVLAADAFASAAAEGQRMSVDDAVAVANAMRADGGQVPEAPP